VQCPCENANDVQAGRTKEGHDVCVVKCGVRTVQVPKKPHAVGVAIFEAGVDVRMLISPFLV
jgi:hypothetical protein